MIGWSECFYSDKYNTATGSDQDNIYGLSTEVQLDSSLSSQPHSLYFYWTPKA